MEVVGMPFVIAEPCIDVLDQACVTVCPVACIHFDQGKDRKLYIDPDECIDCGACEPMCPVEAIYSDLELPSEWNEYSEIDALWYRDKDAARAMVEAAKKRSDNV
jgi:ferredoxin